MKFGMTLKAAKEGFFDRQAVISRVDKATQTALSKIGAFVRTRAKRSIRKRRRVSRPGETPTSQTGLLRDRIYFAYDQTSRSVVIGPVALSGTLDGTAPRNLEYGGSIRRSFTTWIEVDSATFDRDARMVDGKKMKRIRVPRGTRIEARPFMGPALEAERPNMPAMWRDSVRR